MVRFLAQTEGGLHHNVGRKEHEDAYGRRKAVVFCDVHLPRGLCVGAGPGHLCYLKLPVNCPHYMVIFKNHCSFNANSVGRRELRIIKIDRWCFWLPNLLWKIIK